MIDIATLRFVKLSERTVRSACRTCKSTDLYWAALEGHADDKSYMVRIDANSYTRAVPKGGNVGGAYVHVCDRARAQRIADNGGDDAHPDHKADKAPEAKDIESMPTAPAAPATKVPANVDPERLALIASLLAPTPAVDLDTVQAMIKSELDGYVFPTRTAVQRPDGTRREIEGLTHNVLADVLTAIIAGEYVYLVGPAGTGKSHMAEQVAESLALPFHGAISVSAGTLDSDIMGFVVPGTGEFHGTPVTEAYEHGGVACLDEIDKGHPGIISVVNALTSNGSATFAGRLIKRHDDFRLIVTGNTYGNGPDRMYVGSCQLDKATLTRFTQVDVPIDPALELALCLGTGLDGTRVKSVLSYINGLRKNIDKHRLPIVLSPRTTIGVCRLLGAGMTWDKAHAMRVRAGITDTDWTKVSDGVKIPTA